jgi:enamine deaminase RidA (YjgF/YER057c/UK114 family)
VQSLRNGDDNEVLGNYAPLRNAEPCRYVPRRPGLEVPLGADARLKERNITLPPAASTVANYIDSVRVGNLLFLAGNTAGPDWKFKGKVGKDITVQEGYETAWQVGLIMLAKVRAALGSLDRVKRVVKVLGMVNSPEGFGDQPRVMNGFSDLMVEIFGEEIGKHARSAVGMQALPSNSAVEVEMIRRDRMSQ